MDLQYHLPVCPTCHLPLHQAEGNDTQGICPSIHCPHDGQVFTREDWSWLHQDVFDFRDVPPYDGWLPIRLEAS